MRTHSDPRFRKRLPCRVTCGTSRYDGTITNLSRSGLFVQTSAGVAPGDRVDVALEAPTARPDLVLRTRVVWKRLLPTVSLDEPTACGIGVHIEEAPETYQSLLEAIERLASQIPRELGSRKPAPPETRARFRIRLQQIGGTRSRTFEVDAESEYQARRSALAMAGPEWSIIAIEPFAAN